MVGRQRLWLIVPVAVLVALMLPLRAGFTDDGYIHIQYAQNIITHGEYSFNRGEVSFGTTSPLWVMLQAAIGWITGGGERLIASSRVISWLSGIAAVLCMFVLGRSLGLAAPLAYAGALVLAAQAWFVRWTALSMETSSAVMALVAVGIVSVRAFESRRAAAVLGLWMAIAALLRPEAYLLLPVYLATAVLRRHNRRWTCVGTTVVVFAALIVPWLTFARLYIGSFLPNTAGAKSGGMILDPALFVAKLRPIARIVGSTDGIPLILAAVSLVVFRTRSRLVSPDYRFMILWTVALPVAYVLFDIQVLSRYMLLVSPFIIVTGFAGLADVFESRNIGRRAQWVGALGAALVIGAVNTGLYAKVVLPPSIAFSRNLSHELKNLALYVRDNSAPDAVVAAADIGYLAFYSERRVLDLGGLVDRDTHRLREAHTYEEIIAEGLYLGLPRYPHVDFVIDRERVADRFDGTTMHGYRFERVRTERIENLGIRKPGPFFYTLYRLHRDG